MTYAGTLVDFEFFSGFTNSQLSLIGATGREVVYPAGQRLFYEGAPAKGCWLIERGQIDVESAQPDGTTKVLQSLGAGEVAGWSWLVPPYRWHFDAVVVAPTTAILLDTDRLRQFMSAEPDLGYVFARKVCDILLQRLQSSRHATQRPQSAAVDSSQTAVT